MGYRVKSYALGRLIRLAVLQPTSCLRHVWAVLSNISTQSLHYLPKFDKIPVYPGFISADSPGKLIIRSTTFQGIIMYLLSTILVATVIEIFTYRVVNQTPEPDIKNKQKRYKSKQITSAIITK